jgi:MoaA/NifB/PqqE/SkfB family radical SAM enzyme
MTTCNKNERDGQLAAPFRTIQIHPSRKCNLACLHCYSSSGPGYKQMLGIEPLKKFLVYAWEHGFNNLAISGGEPFLYDKLEELFIFSKSTGYQNTMASNGMLLTSARNQRILEYVDLIAISADGRPELHDHIRGQKGAFDKMIKGVNVLQSMQKPFGFIHTITPESWDSLLWLAEFAYDNGAKLLQLHPLEMYGRATDNLASSQIDDTFGHQVFIMANYLKSKYAGKMVVQLDLLHRDYLEMFPAVVNTFGRQCAGKGSVSDLLDTIIIEETGRILPIAYGFEPEFAIGNVNDFQPSMFSQFIEEKVPALKNLFNETLRKIFLNKEVDIVNWTELLVKESGRVHHFER